MFFRFLFVYPYCHVHFVDMGAHILSFVCVSRSMDRTRAACDCRCEASGRLKTGNTLEKMESHAP